MEYAALRSMNQDLSRARRLVVKIGSALLVDQESGAVRRDWLNALADDINQLRSTGTEIPQRLLATTKTSGRRQTPARFSAS